MAIWTLPHFEGDFVRMVTFTNCESVELFVNDESMGEKSLSDFPDHMMTWYVPYVPGTIRAVGKNGGIIACSHEMATAGKPYGLSLRADRPALAKDENDIHVEVTSTDKKGLVVPDAENEITFDLRGEGAILGIDNGDLTSDESYKGNRRRAHAGRCLVIVRANGNPGTIHVTAFAEGLKPGVVTMVTEGDVDKK